MKMLSFFVIASIVMSCANEGNNTVNRDQKRKQEGKITKQLMMEYNATSSDTLLHFKSTYRLTSALPGIGNIFLSRADILDVFQLDTSNYAVLKQDHYIRSIIWLLKLSNEQLKMIDSVQNTKSGGYGKVSYVISPNDVQRTSYEATLDIESEEGHEVELASLSIYTGDINVIYHISGSLIQVVTRYPSN